MSTTTAIVSVYVDESRLEMNSVSGKVFGPFCIALGEDSFPDRAWTDFVGTALASWANEVARLVSDASYVAECHFMDGPYWLELGQAGGGTVRIVGYERSKDDSRRTLVERIVSADRLVREILDALQKVLATCNKMGWSTNDTKDVADALAAFKGRIAH